jgi:hypothetical protein
MLASQQRLLRLEQCHREHNIELTENHSKPLEKSDSEFRERHIKGDFSGELAAIDTFMVGNLKGIGKLYLQTVIDCHLYFAFGNFYTSKVPETAVPAA